MTKKEGRFNRKAKNFVLNTFVFSLTLGLLLFVGFAFAAQLVYPSSGQGTNFTAVGQHISQFYNITVNNTNLKGENITEIYINLSYNGKIINITDGTFNSSLGVGTTTNQSINLSAITINGGNTTVYIWFNATADTPVKAGNFSFVMTANATSVQKNITSVNINDTFTINYVGRSNVSGTNLSQNYIPLHLNITGNQTTISLRVSLHNSTGEIYRNISVGGAVVNGSGIEYNFSNLTDGTDLPAGTYVLEVIANNSNGDMNNTANRTYILDRTGPTVTLAQNNGTAETTKTQVTVDITTSDALTSIAGTCTVDSSSATITGSAGSQTLVEASLTCGTRYVYTVTCKDTAGNSGASSEYGAATLACGGSNSNSNSGGGSGTTTQTWSNTFVENDQELSVKGSISKDLANNERIKLKISGEEHHVGIKAITSDKVTVEIASEPQQAELGAGESENFDVDADGYYDLKVTVTSISGSKANIMIESMRQQVIESEQDTETTNEVSNGSGLLGSSEDGLSSGAWIAIIIAIIVVIGLVVFFIKKKK